MKRIGSGALHDFTPPRARGETAILLMPALGGNAVGYATWVRHLGNGFRILAAQYPGRGMRDEAAPASSIEMLAAELANEIRIHINEPLVIFGHSMGALIGYETAWHLQEVSQPVLGLYSSAALSPIEYSDVHVGADEKSAIEIEKLADALNIPLPRAEPIRQRALRVLRHDLSLIDRYRYSRAAHSLTCSITVITAKDDQIIPSSSAERWSDAGSRPITRHEIPGEHEYFYHAIAPVAHILRAAYE